MQPTPSPQMGRLLINNSGSMAPPPAAAPKSAGSSQHGPRSAAKPSPGGVDLLSDCLQLNNQQLNGVRRPAPPASAAAAGATSRRPPPPRSFGRPVHTLPLDWSLKRTCLITSPSSLAWGARSMPSVRAAALQDHFEALASVEADEDGHESLDCAGLGASACAGASGVLGVALEQALVQWRHPAQRLPPLLAKQLVNASAGSAEKAHAEALNDAWDAALRALFVALRDGRLPYFYCRAEAPPREATAATAGHFCVLWRNTAAANDDGSARAPPPLGWACTDEGSCYAVLSPSSHGLRTALDRARVAYEMPMAPEGTREEAPGSAADDAFGRASDSWRRPLPERSNRPDLTREDAATLAYLNRGRAEEQPDSALGRQRRLAGADFHAASTLLFRGRAALHGLVEFLTNHRAPSTPHFLALQLLSPRPFPHGAPYTPRLVYTPARTRSTADAAAAYTDAADADDTLRLEASEPGGSAMLMPCVLRKLTALLRQTQPRGFDLLPQADSGGTTAEALNLRPAQPPVRPSDIGRTVAPRPQPKAHLWVPLAPGTASGEAGDEDEDEGGAWSADEDHR